ncbi:MAG: DUF1559 domain-containing protein [Pirellulales bacterium]
MSIAGIFAYRYRQNSLLTHQCKQNLMLIGLAMHEYHSRYGCFPPRYTVDEDGQPLHSWRALLLPFLGEHYAHKRIDFSLPWDDPENLRTYDSPISVYQCPACKHTGTSCSYIAVAGSAASLTSGSGAPLYKFQGQPIMILESKSGIAHWASTEDLDLDQTAVLNQALPSKANSPHLYGLHGVSSGGGVEFLENGLSTASLLSKVQPVNPAFSRAKILSEFQKRGGPYRILNFSKPQDPPQIVEVEGESIDLSQLSLRKLESMFNIAVGAKDMALARSVAAYKCKLDQSGWIGLAEAAFQTEDFDGACYWLQEGLMTDGLSSARYSRLSPLMFRLPKFGEFEKFPAFMDAIRDYWIATEPGTERVFKPSNLASDTAHPLLILLHPAFSNQEFFDSEFCQGIAEKFQCTVVTCDGTERVGPTSFVWTEDYGSTFRGDVKRIAKVVSKLIADNKIKQPSQQILAGTFGGGFTATMVSRLEPNTYAGAVAICPNIAVAGSMTKFSIKSKEASQKQRYSLWYSAKQRGMGEFISKDILKNIPEVATDFSSEQVEFARQSTISPQLAERIKEGLKWFLDSHE